MEDKKKSKVLVVGGTGYLGKRIVKASLDLGHPTYVLQRCENCMDINKIQLLLSFKKLGAQLIEGSLSDHQSLVRALKQVDVVVSAIASADLGPHILLLQLKLVDAIKEAGNVKRFVPSEFGTDPARMDNALEPGRVLSYECLMSVRKAIEDAEIPFTYIAANSFAGYYVGSLWQLDTLVPPRDKLCIFGDGNVKAIYLDEDDVAIYTIKTIDDPRTINKTLHLRPPENILSQNELVSIWERLIGRKLEKSSLSAEDFLATMKGADYFTQMGVTYNYHIYYDACQTSFELGEGGEEASELYPEVKYTRVMEYLEQFV